ncbi:MAG: SPW repeat protein, partial [Gammaproteobacteria bacterium]
MKERWQDLIVLAFGVWLLCSPWWLEYFTGYPYTDQTAASWNSIFFGLAITLFAIWVLVLPEKWEEWINLVVGLWLVASPWALRFDTYTVATVNMLVVGGIVALCAAIGLGKLYTKAHYT